MSGVAHGRARRHGDIESDDLEAEVRRLEALGARRVAFVKRWWVMEAPAGQRFRVVNPQRGALEGKARRHGLGVNPGRAAPTERGRRGRGAE